MLVIDVSLVGWCWVDMVDVGCVCVLVLGERQQLFNRQSENRNKNEENLTKYE